MVGAYLATKGQGLNTQGGGIRHQALHPTPAGSSIQVERKLAVAVIMADPECLSVTVNQEVLLNRNLVLFKVRRPERRYVRVLGCCPSGPLHSEWNITDLIIPPLSPRYTAFECVWILGQMWKFLYFSLSFPSSLD